MRRVLVSLMASLSVTIAIILGFYFYSIPFLAGVTSLIDRLNPLVQTEEVYLKVPNNYQEKISDPVNKGDKFTYVEKGFNKKGCSHKIKLVSLGKKLKAGQYLKVKTKRRQVQQWQEISKKEVPKEVINQLN